MSGRAFFCAVRRTVAACAAVVFGFGNASAAGGRVTRDYNGGWSFSFDRRQWRDVRIPHDWAIAGPFCPTNDSATAKLPWRGVGYYRKALEVSRPEKGRRYVLDFDGIMCDGTVFVNGQPCGHQPYGYLGLRADITPYLTETNNVVEVRADTTKLKSRWYPGAGLYRRVRFVETDDVCLDERDVRVLTPRVDARRAEIEIRGQVTSHRVRAVPARVVATVTGGGTRVSAERKVELAPCDRTDFALKLSVDAPRLWEMTNPAELYAVRVEVIAADARDAIDLRTGLRDFRFDANDGFLLNGRRVQLKGVCLHADQGPLGIAFNRSEMRRRFEILREMGFNALRTAHNPVAPELLDLCDEMGIFVWNECFDKWNETCGRKDERLEDYVSARLEEFVRRDRNHPSVFVWSLGGEIPSRGGYSPGQEIWNMPASVGSSSERCTLFRNVIRRFDDTRPVGIANIFTESAVYGDYENLDITGWNYGAHYLKMRELYPDKPILMSETTSAYSEYGYYAKSLPTNIAEYAMADFAIDSYDRNCATWGELADLSFEYQVRDPYLAGEFIWSGIDYLGEPAPYAWPELQGHPTPPETHSRSSYFGACDLLALPKDRYWLYRAQWNAEAFTLHIVPDHWNFPERAGRRLPVYVYTSADEAELFINGVSQGRRRKDPSAKLDGNRYSFSVLPKYRLMWHETVYQPGEVKVVAYGRDGKPCGTEVLRTAGAAARVVLKPYRNALPDNFEDLLFVQVTLEDAQGVRVPCDRRRVSYRVEGPAEIVAVGNSDPRGTDSFKDVGSHPLCHGRGGLYLRRTGAGPVRLTASADDVAPAEVMFP